MVHKVWSPLLQQLSFLVVTEISAFQCSCSVETNLVPVVVGKPCPRSADELREIRYRKLEEWILSDIVADLSMGIQHSCVIPVSHLEAYLAQ